LGYTYDWGTPHNPIGLSEFIITGGATVSIHFAAETQDYFLSNWEPYGHLQ
jgi:hypothetical protein